jgi:hypothetical protein
MPLLGGLLGALALVGLYVGIIGVAESPAHALQQLKTDALWVALVSTGFGTQIGLYLRIRGLVRRSGPHKALTGAGTGASTLGMVACCAHHLTDLAPLIGLTAATAFLSEYRLAFIIGGLAVNLVGILWSIRTLRRVTQHLRAMETTSEVPHA